MHLLGEIAVLLGVYKLRILAVGDYLIDVSTILVFVCKNRVVFAEFQHIDGSARWLTSFNYNRTPHADTLPSTWSLLTHGAVAALLVLCSRGRNILSVAKKLHRLCCCSIPYTIFRTIRVRYGHTRMVRTICVLCLFSVSSSLAIT